MDEEKEKTALFFMGKCYLSIAEALLLYSGDFVCSYRQRGEIFSSIFKKKFPELYQIIPDLDKKVLLHTNIKLMPNSKELNIDFQELWFEARDDTLKVISYYLSKIYPLKKRLLPDDPLYFSRSAEKILQKRLLLKYLRFYLGARGIKTNNMSLINLLNSPAQLYINFLFFREVLKNYGKANSWTLFSMTDPGIKFYSSLVLCLCAIDKNNNIDPFLVDKGYGSLKRFFPIQNFKNPDNFLNWKNLCEQYTLAFRAYQFLKI
jgi:hypothetical protein